nr:MAG TPA: hypothetical protein [Caudoviricetes sp.]
MKLFDIMGDKVVVHAEMWALPPFKKLWESNKDKKHADDVASFIILCDYWNSPYVKSMNTELREKTLKQSKFGDENYHLTEDEELCRAEYNNLLNTRLLKMLKSMNDKLDTISSYYANSLDEELDETKIQKLLAGFEKVKGTVQTIDFLEKAVKAEELENSKVRGNVQINPYELNK